MKSNMIAKGLLTAAVAGLVAGAIAPSTALAGKKGGAKHECGKDGHKSGECKDKKDNGCNGCNGKESAAPATGAAPAAPAAPAEHK